MGWCFFSHWAINYNVTSFYMRRKYYKIQVYSLSYNIDKFFSFVLNILKTIFFQTVQVIYYVFLIIFLHFLNLLKVSQCSISFHKWCIHLTSLPVKEKLTHIETWYPIRYTRWSTENVPLGISTGWTSAILLLVKMSFLTNLR